jgi:hypothetical protein
LLAAVNTFDDVLDPDDGLTSLREAIAQVADDGMVDTISLPTGTYPLALGELLIEDTDALTIAATGGPATIDALGASRVFHIAAGSDVTLDSLVITGDSTAESGGGIVNRGNLVIQDSTLQGNSAVGGGGALWNVDFGLAEITNTLVCGSRGSRRNLLR